MGSLSKDDRKNHSQELHQFLYQDKVLSDFCKMKVFPEISVQEDNRLNRYPESLLLLSTKPHQSEI